MEGCCPVLEDTCALLLFCPFYKSLQVPLSQRFGGVPKVSKKTLVSVSAFEILVLSNTKKKDIKKTPKPKPNPKLTWLKREILSGKSLTKQKGVYRKGNSHYTVALKETCCFCAQPPVSELCVLFVCCSKSQATETQALNVFSARAWLWALCR